MIDQGHFTLQIAYETSVKTEEFPRDFHDNNGIQTKLDDISNEWIVTL